MTPFLYPEQRIVQTNAWPTFLINEALIPKSLSEKRKERKYVAGNKGYYC